MINIDENRDFNFDKLTTIDKICMYKIYKLIIINYCLSNYLINYYLSMNLLIINK